MTSDPTASPAPPDPTQDWTKSSTGVTRAPDLTGLKPSYGQPPTSMQAVVIACAVTVTLTGLVTNLIDGHPRSAAVFGVLVVLQVVMRLQLSKRPLATGLTEAGLTTQTPLRTQRVAWADISAVHPAGRWESMSTATRRDGTRVNLYGVPAEAALRLQESLADLPDRESASSAPARSAPPAQASTAPLTARDNASANSAPVTLQNRGTLRLGSRGWRSYALFLTGWALVVLAGRGQSFLPHGPWGTAEEVALLVVGIVCVCAAGWLVISVKSRGGEDQGSSTSTR